MARRLALAAAVFAGLVAAPAALADGDRLAAAFVQTASAPSVRAVVAGTVTTQGQTVPLRAVVASDTRTGSARLSIRIANPSVGGPRSISFSAVVDGRTHAFYLRFPLLAQLAGAKKPWLKVPLGKQGLDLGSLGQVDPTQQLALACALSGATRNLGPATVDGVATTHFRARVDYQQAARCAPAAQRAAVRGLAHDLAGLPVVPIDVYVDARGYIRRMALDLALGRGKDRARTALTIDLSAFGQPVNVQPPPASQIASLKSLSSDLGGLLPGGD